MSNLFGVFDVAGSGMAAESYRLNTVASNLANADTVASSPDQAYHAKEPLFSAIHKSALDAQSEESVGVHVDGVSESQADIEARYDPGNPMADADGYVYGSNVNPMEEMVNMISASRSYQEDVEAMNTTKGLMLQTLKLGD